MSLSKPMASGRQHVIKSSIWIFGGQFLGQILRLISNLVLTRLLVPEMFGVMAIANTMIVGLSLCTYMGLEHNIIQNSRGDDQDFLDASWAFQIVRGVFIWLAALGISLGLYLANAMELVPAGSVYADESLPSVLAALSFMALIGGFETMNHALAARHMLIDKITKVELGSQLFGLITMITFALIHKSIWALVAGTMVGLIARVILGYVVFPGKINKFLWDKSTLIELFHFGKWILITTIIGFLIQNGDKLILGALITPEMLGIYTIAFFMTSAILEMFSKWASSIVLPTLSRVYRENRAEFKNTYYKYSFPYNAACLFVCGVLINAGYILIEVLYDDRYSAAGLMIHILAISILGSRIVLADQCFVAMGKPKFSAPAKTLQLVTLFGALIPAYRYFGMDGALYVIAGNILLTLPVTWYLLKKLGVLDWKREVITLPFLALGYGFSMLLIATYNAIKGFVFN